MAQGNAWRWRWVLSSTFFLFLTDKLYVSVSFQFFKISFRSVFLSFRSIFISFLSRSVPFHFIPDYASADLHSFASNALRLLTLVSTTYVHLPYFKHEVARAKCRGFPQHTSPSPSQSLLVNNHAHYVAGGLGSSEVGGHAQDDDDEGSNNNWEWI